MQGHGCLSALLHLYRYRYTKQPQKSWRRTQPSTRIHQTAQTHHYTGPSGPITYSLTISIFTLFGFQLQDICPAMIRKHILISTYALLLTVIGMNYLLVPTAAFVRLARPLSLASKGTSSVRRFSLATDLLLDLGSKSSGNQKQKRVKAILFDCDGVLWHGDESIPESIDAIERITKASPDVKLLYVTNNSAKTRWQYVEKFRKFGLDIHLDQLVTSVTATMFYLQKKNMKRIIFIGADAVKNEMIDEGFEVVDMIDSENPTISSGELDDYPVDPSVEAVVISYDQNFTYRKLAIATLYLTSTNAELVGTNYDQADRTNSGRMIAGTGPLIKSAEFASRKPATICGKPTNVIVEHVLQRMQGKVAREETLMVGDRLDTDIEFANSANFLSCLVLTGCTSADDVLAELRSSGGFDMKGMNTSNVIGPLPNTTSSKLPTVVTASLEELTNKYLQVP